MSLTTAHSLGSALRCHPPPPLHPGPALRGGSPSHAPTPPAPQVTSEGKSSSDDAPSSQDVGPSQHHDEDKSEEIVAQVAAEKEIAAEEEIVAEIAAEEEIVAEVAAEEEVAEEDETVAEEDDVAAEAAFRKHLEDVALEPPTFSQGVETSTAAVQGVALAPQASSADAPAPDERKLKKSDGESDGEVKSAILTGPVKHAYCTKRTTNQIPSLEYTIVFLVLNQLLSQTSPPPPPPPPNPPQRKPPRLPNSHKPGRGPSAIYRPQH